MNENEDTVKGFTSCLPAGWRSAFTVFFNRTASESGKKDGLRSSKQAGSTVRGTDCNVSFTNLNIHCEF